MRRIEQEDILFSLHFIGNRVDFEAISAETVIELFSSEKESSVQILKSKTLSWVPTVVAYDKVKKLISGTQIEKKKEQKRKKVIRKGIFLYIPEFFLDRVHDTVVVTLNLSAFMFLLDII